MRVVAASLAWIPAPVGRPPPAQRTARDCDDSSAVHLAVTLVQWFALGAIRRSEGRSVVGAGHVGRREITDPARDGPYGRCVRCAGLGRAHLARFAARRVVDRVPAGHATMEVGLPWRAAPCPGGEERPLPLVEGQICIVASMVSRRARRMFSDLRPFPICPFLATIMRTARANARGQADAQHGAAPGRAQARRDG